MLYMYNTLYIIIMGSSENYNIIILFYNIIQYSDPFFFQN